VRARGAAARAGPAAQQPPIRVAGQGGAGGGEGGWTWPGGGPVAGWGGLAEAEQAQQGVKARGA
jgi:hypothetical protein